MPMDRLTPASLEPPGWRPGPSRHRDRARLGPGTHRDRRVTGRACRGRNCQSGLRAWSDMNAISLLSGRVAGGPRGALTGCLYARGHLAGQAAAADERARAAHDRAALIERAAQERVALAEGTLAEHFQVLAGQALDQSSRRFLEMATGRLEAANAKAAGELDT